MPRGPISAEKKIARQLEKLKSLGLLNEDSSVESPVEDIHDKIREAQAVIEYFEATGNKFWHQECSVCGGTFAYKWRIMGVKQCSVTCMARHLEKLGLKWNPNRPPEERFQGSIPVIVPPQALKALLDSVLLAESQASDVLDKASV